MARSLAERLRAHEQQKARLAEQEAKLKDAGRKARTRRLIEAGGLIDKVGLLDLDANELYGALLSLRDGAGDRNQREKWAALGGRTFAHEARLRDEGKEAVVLSFPAPLAKDVTTALRQAGFRFSKVMQHWEGLARFADAERLAQAQGGMARRVAASPALASPAPVRPAAAE
jgi:Conjugal transfer protein TraD